MIELELTHQPSMDDPNYGTIMETHPGLIAYAQHAEAQMSVGNVEPPRILTEGLRRLPSASHFHISWQFGGR
jgi:hypothetical protein